MVARGRLAHGARLPLPLRGECDQGGGGYHQHSGYGRLCRARGVRGPHRHADEPRAQHRQGDHLGALPQRSRLGRRQLARRGAGRGAAGRVHHQRHRRAGRQRLARGNRDGAPHAPRRDALHDRDQDRAHHQGLAPGLDHHRLPGPAQQGDRGGERVRARVGHPPGRRAQERADLRDHDARSRWA